MTIAHTAGASAVKVKRIAVLDGEVAIADLRPDADLGPGALAKREYFLDCQQWIADRTYTMLVEIEALPGQTDSAGSFAIEPWWEETVAASKPTDIDYVKARTEMQAKLWKIFAQKNASFELLLQNDQVRKELTSYELLRRCGADAFHDVSQQANGAEFLQQFRNDLSWMQQFLIQDEVTSWAVALENLRFLHVNCKQTDHPLYRRLATAMACAAGPMNRYRMLDRYRDVIRVHQEGLLHVSFDDLDVREMRWAVPLAGTAKDYKYMVDVMQYRLSEYIGACWGIPYIDPNVYGYSVQGWGYADPWTHHYGTGTGDRPFIAQRHVGGVCVRCPDLVPS